MYDKFIVKVKTINIKRQSISGLVIKTNYDSEKLGLENKVGDFDRKISNTRWLIKNNNYNTKITETEIKILKFTGLVTTDTLNTKLVSASTILEIFMIIC